MGKIEPSVIRIRSSSMGHVKHEDGKNYATWYVEVLNSEGKWNLITACYGGASASSAMMIAQLWRDGGELPSLSRLSEYFDKEGAV